MAPKGPKKVTPDGQPLAGDNAKPEKPKSEKRSKKEPKKTKAQKQLEKQASNSGAPAATDLANSSNSSQVHSNANLSNKKAPKKRAPPPPPFANGRPPQLDPLLLARGMSSRYLSSKISHQLTPLAKESVEKDLRHMEAYRNACNGYNQQLFVFKNQELVRSGYFGTFAPFPGEDGDVIRPMAPSSSATAAGSGSKFSMPIKIDPEEEKRLSMLRKKIHQSEFEREKLETEYLSLRAHYVHESQLVRKTRSYEMGRWKMLRELMNRRAKVLGLMRVKIAMGRDVEKLLKYRGELAQKVKNGTVNGGDAKSGAAANTMNGSGTNNGAGAASASGKAVDLIEIWNDINAQLKQAELACMELETPAVLSQMVMGSTSDQTSSNGNRSRSPTRNDSDKNAKSRKRSSSITSAEEATSSNTAESSSSNKKSKSLIPQGLEPHVIPWDCMVEPQTPFDVPLLLSCLSSATDRAVGFLTDKTNPTAITWLESTLPTSTSAYKSDAEDLNKLREESRLLEEELNSESVRNTELQKHLIASRSRSDEMVAMMQLLRSETEAVLERHNIIMETPEARAKSAALHKKLLDEEKLKNPSAAGVGEEMEEEEEGEVDEMNEDLSSGEEDQDEDEEEDRSDDESVGIKEITVDKDAASNNVAAGEEGEEESDVDEIDEDDGSEEEGEIAEEGEVVGEGDEDGEPARRSKRRTQGDGEDADEESSSLTPPNSSSLHRKRRRY